MPDTRPVATEPFARVPQHLAVIMDGNGRWARARGLSTAEGHRAGVESVRTMLKLCDQFGINVLTIFAFSSENWSRPKAEVSALMTLFSSYLKKEVKKLHEDGVRIRFIGRRDRFSKGLLKQMAQAEALTSDNAATTLVIAVDYGGQWDIAHAARQLAEQVEAGQLQPEQIDVDRLGRHMALADLPSPDLCIRTSGELRISNFLLWQLAYAELFFTDTLWPDFAEADMRAALACFNRRERRYGGRNTTQGELGA